MDTGAQMLWAMLYYFAGFVLFYIVIYKLFPSFKDLIYEQEMRDGEKRRYYLLYCLVSSIAFWGYIGWLFVKEDSATSITLSISIIASIIVILAPTLKDLVKGDYLKTLRLFKGCKPGDILQFMVQWSVLAFYAEFDYVDFAKTTVRDISTGSEINILNKDLGKYQTMNLTKGANRTFLVRYDDGAEEKVPLGYAFTIDFYLKNNINMKEIEDMLVDNANKGKVLNKETNLWEDVTDEWIMGYYPEDPKELKPAVSWSFYPGFVKAKFCFRCEAFYQGMIRARRIIPKRVFHLLRDKGILLDEVQNINIPDKDKTDPIQFRPNIGVQDE